MGRSISLIALTLIAPLGSVAVASPDRTIGAELLHVGEFSAMDVTPNSGDEWYALVTDSSRGELRKCRIAVKSTSEPESTGGGHFYRRVRIEVDAPMKPKLLLRGIPTLRDGPLRTDMSAIG